MPNEDKSLDVLGIKPVAESINTVTKGAVDGASAFLSRICLPAAEEFGLLLRDKVSGWRAKNAVAIVTKAQELLDKHACDLVLHAHPRIVYSALEHGSWAEDDYMQNLWAGLMATSCTESGKDESNLIFINILSNLTTSQGKLINYICENSEKYKTKVGLIMPKEHFFMKLEQLHEVMELSDIHQIDRELDHLRSLELIENGFSPDDEDADVTPKALCLQMYCRCKGYIGSPTDFYDAKNDTTKYHNSLVDIFNKNLT